MTLLLYHTPAQERGISVPVASFIPRDRSLGGDAFFLLDLLLARRPLVLQFLVQREPVHVLGPPLAPARQEHLLRVLGNVVPEEGPQQARATYNKSVYQPAHTGLLFKVKKKAVREAGHVVIRTFRNRFCIGHAHVHLHAAVSREVGPRDQAGRHGDNLTGAVKLALPPLGA